MSKIYMFPGQGSQKVGMGGDLFDRFTSITEEASDILGYSIKTLCLEDSGAELTQTQFTQPALYVVNALTMFADIEDSGTRPDFAVGHSLGEYDALLAAEAYDFGTGLKLVQKRGALMSGARGGGMAAVIGLSPDDIQRVLENNELGIIAMANLNAPSQTVISGVREDVVNAAPAFKAAGATYIPLKVSGAFHSRLMVESADEFASFLEGFSFSSLVIPVISNVTGRPYVEDSIPLNLTMQIKRPVSWVDSIRYLLEQDQPEFLEVGPGKVLSGLLKKIRKG